MTYTSNELVHMWRWGLARCHQGVDSLHVELRASHPYQACIGITGKPEYRDGR